MISSEEIYGVVVALFPLYVSLILGYASVKWWRMFNRDHCDGINRFICFFILPLFGFDFTAHINPFKMNFRLIGADALSKVVILSTLAAWGKFSTKASYSWCVTTFSLCTLTNLLVVGVPVISAMYGPMGVSMVVQLNVLQSLVWLPLLLLFLEFQMTGMLSTDLSPDGNSSSSSSSSSNDDHGDIEGSDDYSGGEKRSFWSITRVVGMKLAVNPNVYASVFGLVWALLASRFKFTMPNIMSGSVEILSKAGTGTAMFNIGIFMATQKKVIACGMGPMVLGLVARFAVGPVIMALCSLAVGLRGATLRVAIVQAALPQAIASFVVANEYGLHANVLSTAVVVGTMVSLPLLIGYSVASDYAV